MSNNIRLLLLFLFSILVSSLLGWHTVNLSLTNSSAKNGLDNWNLPKQSVNNRTSLNQQLTNLKIWGQVQKDKRLKTQSQWRLVGISHINGKLIALIEISNELSLKRVLPGKTISDNIKLISIGQDSIEVSDNGQNRKIVLYP